MECKCPQCSNRLKNMWGAFVCDECGYTIDRNHYVHKGYGVIRSGNCIFPLHSPLSKEIESYLAEKAKKYDISLNIYDETFGIINAFGNFDDKSIEEEYDKFINIITPYTNECIPY